ncbi:MAG: hypothetical protein IIX54_03555 [Clostridia bacterium]|nr:hypothetical protein [Clostridia bacterium]
MKKLFFIIIFALILSVNVFAEGNLDEILTENQEEELYELLSPDAERVIENFEIDITDTEWVNNLTPESVFSQIWDFIKTGAKTPLKCGGIMLSAMLLIAAANTFEGFAPFKSIASYIFTLGTVSAVMLPMFSLIESASSAIKGISVLMDGFVPTYAGILALSGKAATATGMSFLLLFAVGIVGSLSSFVIVPLMSCYLGVAVAGSVMPNGATNKLGDGIKKAAVWILSLTLTLFLGVLSVQTTVNKAADNLGLKTAKFMIGSFIPVAGGALSETLGTLIGSVNLIKSSVGMFAVVAISAIVLPIVIELLIWRLMLMALGIVSELLGVGIKTDILAAADSVLAVLIGVLLFVGALFIISLGIISGGV